MPEVNVREVAERVVCEHGGGWMINWASNDGAGLYPPEYPKGGYSRCIEIRKRWTDASVEVIPRMAESRSYEQCRSNSEAWPEMKRLCDMLREACQ